MQLPQRFVASSIVIPTCIKCRVIVNMLRLLAMHSCTAFPTSCHYPWALQLEQTKCKRGTVHVAIALGKCAGGGWGIVVSVAVVRHGLGMGFWMGFGLGMGLGRGMVRRGKCIPVRPASFCWCAAASCVKCVINVSYLVSLPALHIPLAIIFVASFPSLFRTSLCTFFPTSIPPLHLVSCASSYASVNMASFSSCISFRSPISYLCVAHFSSSFDVAATFRVPCATVRISDCIVRSQLSTAATPKQSPANFAWLRRRFWKSVCLIS